jgi:hypothetical protein
VLAETLRDISKVWVLDPESKHYLEIPYRSLANPAVTLWEHKKAVAKLREKGRAQLNEAAIFRMIDSMREITETAAKERKRARLDKARRVHLEASPKKTKLLLIVRSRQPSKLSHLRILNCGDSMSETGPTLSHLAPPIEALAMLADEERLQLIRSDRWIGYTRARSALQRLEELLKWPSKTRMPNLLLIGPTNNGKSVIIEKFRRDHILDAYQSGDHEVIPIVVTQMPSEPSVVRFYTLLIASMGTPVIGAPLRRQRKIAELESLALKLLRTVNAKMIVIDELHNILAGKTSVQKEFLNLLRFLGNELRIPIVGVGTRDAYLAIRSDDQLENRFEPIPLPLWEEGDELLSLLASFTAVLPLKKPSGIATEEVARYVLSRTEGTIGEIAKLLTAAAVAAIESGEESLNKRTLELAAYQSPSELRRSFERILL